MPAASSAFSAARAFSSASSTVAANWWSITGGANLLSELRCADDLNQHYLGGVFTDRELVQMVTSRPAELVGMGGDGPARIGRLAEGAAADFILVRDDYFEVPEQDIWKNQVLGTWVGGRHVYSRDE